MRRKDREMTEAWARTVIERCDYGILSTVDGTGQPYGVAVSHVLVGDKLYFHCALAGRKLENLAKNPKVSMSFVGKATLLREGFTVGYESVVVEGIGKMITEEAEKLEALRAICKRYALEDAAANDAYILPQLGVTGVCCIDITAIAGKSNQK